MINVEWYYYLIIAVVIVILIGILGQVMKIRLESSMIIKIVGELKHVLSENISVEVVKSKPFQIEVNTADATYVIKAIRFNPNHELIITNQYFWCINENIKNYKRSEKPVLISGVPEFLKYQIEANKKVIKLAIIYPGCYNRTRYLNESDVELVNFKKAVHQVYFLTFDEIKDFFLSK